MIALDTLILFIAASAALGLAPGPDNIFVLTQSALYGRKSGFFVTLGLCTGLVVHTAAVALGIAVIFKTSELAFTLLKLAGAAYLVYLAWGAWRAGSTALPQDDEGAKVPSVRKLYLRGIIMNVTNPKVAIFFLAFLPQFADPATGSVSLQMLMLGGIFMLVTLAVFGGVAFGAGMLGGWLRSSPRIQIWMNRMAAIIFVGLAARLMLTER